MLEEEMELLPDYCLEGLTGGVLADPSAMLHPKALQNDLYILGVYERDTIGCRIVLYYGSFVMTGYGSGQRARDQIRETLRHEVRHHLECRAGIYYRGSLIEEDRDRMIEYYRSHDGGK